MNFRGNTGAYLHDFKVGSEELVDRLIVFGLTDSILSNLTLAMECHGGVFCKEG